MVKILFIKKFKKMKRKNSFEEHECDLNVLMFYNLLKIGSKLNFDIKRNILSDFKAFLQSVLITQRNHLFEVLFIGKLKLCLSVIMTFYKNENSDFYRFLPVVGYKKQILRNMQIGF